MDLQKIPTGKDIPKDIYAIIEIPAYSNSIKYEINKTTGVVFVDRIIYTAMFYPCNYGYINHTLALDGDPVDILVPTPQPLQTSSVIRCRPIGMLKMIDESGEDNKIIAVPHQKISKDYDNIKNIHDVPSLLKEQISHFFKYYKKLDTNKWVEIKKWENACIAENEISSAVQRALSKNKQKSINNKKPS